MSTWAAAIAKLRGDVGRLVEQKLLGVFGWTLSASSSAMGDKDQVQTADTGKGERPARRLEQWGVRGVPPSKIRSLWIRIGSSNVVFLGIAPTKKYGPTDLATGETCVYSEQVERALWATQLGDVKLAAKSGRTIQLDGATFKGVKWSDGNPIPAADTGFVGALATFVAALKAAGTVGNIVTAATNFETALTNNSQFRSGKYTNG